MRKNAVPVYLGEYNNVPVYYDKNKKELLVPNKSSGLMEILTTSVIAFAGIMLYTRVRELDVSIALPEIPLFLYVFFSVLIGFFPVWLIRILAIKSGNSEKIAKGYRLLYVDEEGKQIVIRQAKKTTRIYRWSRVGITLLVIISPYITFANENFILYCMYSFLWMIWWAEFLLVNIIERNIILHELEMYKTVEKEKKEKEE